MHDNDNMGREPEPLSDFSSLGAEDYYFDGPYLVFTAEYLRRRGECCGSGCRHCPYRDNSKAASD